MADAQIVNLSTDRRFIMAYSASLTIAIAALDGDTSERISTKAFTLNSNPGRSLVE